MGRSKAALVVLIIGLVILVMSPIFRWGIAPALIKVPDNIDTQSVYNGSLTLLVDPASLAFLGAENAVVIPLHIERHDLSQPEKSSSSVALIKETTNATGPAGKEFINSTHYYALDRKTSENVHGHGSDADRSGYYPILPVGTKKITYDIWSDDTGRAGPVEFQKTVSLESFKYTDVECYQFGATGEPEKCIEPPLGLPKSITGAQIKAIATGDPSMDASKVAGLVDTQKYPITYLKKTDVTLQAEPRTGSIVNVPSNVETYYVDASALGLSNIELAKVKYAQTLENVAEVIDESAANWSLLDLALLWIPLILLIVGVVIAAAGGIWFAVKKPAA